VNTGLVRIALYAVIVIGLANFIGFVLIAGAIGGDALNGYKANGRYFVRMHGRSTEVSESVFTYSKWHATSIFITHPLAMAAAFVLAKACRSQKRG
jgi:hypothetical protein